MVPQKKVKGFSLLEMMLVMAIIASVLMMIMSYMNAKTSETKRDLTVMQYEQILNAGLSYYLNNSEWPETIGTAADASTVKSLVAQGYLPKKTITNSWGGGAYIFYKNAMTGTFTICSPIASSKAAVEAGIMAGRLPMGYVAKECTIADLPPDPSVEANQCATDATTCAVLSTVNIPGQNLNNARSVNFAGLYHNGACVPAPVCPNPYSSANTTGMKPSIVVAPVSVSGNFNGGAQVFPLSSFTAYAVGEAADSGATIKKGDPKASPLPKCTNLNATSPCNVAAPGIPSPSGKYWRVCLDVVTEKGRIGDPGSTWDVGSGTIMVITRCVPQNEPSGSSFSVFESF